MMDTRGHLETFKSKSACLTDRRHKTIFSPLRMVLTLGFSIFAIEFIDMLIIESISGLSEIQQILLDSSILTIILLPILFFYLIRPLTLLVHDYKQSEADLKASQSNLEQRVADRTRELEDALDKLKKKIEESSAAKMALSESEYRFRQLFNQSEDAVILIAPEDGVIIDVNPTAERIFRKQRNDIITGGLESLCSPAGQSPDLKTILEQVASHETTKRIDRFECAIAPGEIRTLSFRGKTISLQGNKVAYTTFRDITARARLEDEAQAIQSRLIQANRMTSLGTMVSSVAHEINNPNNFLLMNANIITKAWVDIAPVIEYYYNTQGDFPVAQSTWSEARTFLPEAFEGIQQGAVRISAIIGNLKNFGREESFHLGSVADVNAVVQLSTSILNHQISQATQNFQLDLAEDLPLVRGSARQLEQVVINLIQNALQALPDPDHGVRVTTGIDPDGIHVLIQVADEGVGISKEIAGRVKEPFFTTRLAQGGTGLGLAISSSIVKDHGGSIEFNSESGQGTTFTVRLLRENPDEVDRTLNGVHHEIH